MARASLAELQAWPADTAPDDAAVFAHNERVLNTPAERAWSWLVRARDWPSWYGNARNVRIDGGGDLLYPGARFRWVTFGTPLRSEVVTFQEPTKLGWIWWCSGAYGFHGWELLTHPRGVRVVTEESQRGSKAARLAIPLHVALTIAHWHWLQRLGAECARERKAKL
jgi:hypothetical protein